MKKNLFIIAAIAGLFIAGCDGGTDDGGNAGGDGQITIPNQNEKNQQAYADDETTGGFTFTAKSAWTASVSEQTRTVSWLRLLHNGAEKYSGDAGTFTLTIELDTNFSGAARSATIDIVSGTDKITVTVTQQGTTKEGETPEPELPDDFSEIIIAALDKTAKSDVLTVRMTETYTSGWPHNQDETTVTWLAYDRAESRKCIEYRTITNNKTSAVTTHLLKYLENDILYYFGSGDILGAKKYICGVEPEVFWDKFNHNGLIRFLDYYCDLPPRNWNKYTWSVDGNEYTAEYSSSSIDEKFVITLDGGRISSISFDSFDYREVINEKTQTNEITFEYVASPALPDGFTEEDFEPAEQYQVKIVWGEGLGESVFHTGYLPIDIDYIGQYGDHGLTPETFKKYTPENPGKTAEYYFDAAFIEPVVSGKPLYVYDNDTVIYVKWIAE